MKKSFALLIVALLAFSLSVEAQTRYNYHKTGYWGNLEAAAGVTLGGGSDIGISTVHGGRLGHGVAMGMGLGFYVDVNSVVSTFYIPLFLETKYSPFKSGRSPYLSLRTGFSINEWVMPGFYLAPALGCDIGRFSFFMRYGLNLYPVSVDIDIETPGVDIETTGLAHIKTHGLSIGFALNF